MRHPPSCFNAIRLGLIHLVCLIFHGLIQTSHADVIAQTRQTGTTLQARDGIAQQCEAAAMVAGRMAGIPEHVLPAIALVESGRRGADGRMHPWPWSINVAGTDHVFDSRAEAVAAVRAAQESGTKSIDIGCLQVNLAHHPHAFATLEQGFDPMTNAIYAASFLRDLHAQSGSWAKAIAEYHSATPALGEAYRQKVMAVLNRTGTDLPANVTAEAAIPHAAGWAEARGLLSGGSRALTAPMAGATGRGLDAYRARPVPVTGQIGKSSG